MPENADPVAKQQALAKAMEVLKEVKAGNDFAALAKQHSTDPGSAPSGGDLGFFERGQMVGPFEQAAFALAPAQTSDLVESPFGYHIIKVTEKADIADDSHRRGPPPDSSSSSKDRTANSRRRRSWVRSEPRGKSKSSSEPS